MDNLKEFSINDIQRVATENSKEFAICKIAVLSTEPNSHGILITEEILRRDVPSILGKWIVADVNKWTMDATTHTVSERIVGMIPKDQEVEFVTRDDGVVVAYVEGVISKIYATDIYDMFVKDNFRSMSVEMATASDTENADGTISIDGLEIYGITILGKTVNGSCPSANMEIVKFSADEATEYYDTIYTKEKALKLAEDLKSFAKSLDNKDNNKTKEIEMAKTKLLAEDVKDEKEKDVVMSEGKENADEPKSEDESKDKEMAKKEEPKEMSEDETQAMSEETPKKLEEDKDTDDDSEDANKEKEMADPKAEGDGQDDTVEMGCGEKEFSLAEFADADLLESYKGSEAIDEFVAMSANDMVKKFAEIIVENNKLREFQTKTFEAEKKQRIDAILAEVKEDLDVKQFAELAEEGSNISFEGIDAFANKVKAFAYEASKNKVKGNKEDDGVMLMATAETNAVVEDGDIWSRLSKKYK